MAAMQPLLNLIGIDLFELSKKESYILEAELFARICEELKEIFKEQHKEYFRVFKFSMDMDHSMIENNFICYVVKDIVMSGEYTLEGIAHYTDTPFDIIVEVASGKNTCPSATLLRRIIELHRTIRLELYKKIMRKIVLIYSDVA